MRALLVVICCSACSAASGGERDATQGSGAEGSGASAGTAGGGAGASSGAGGGAASGGSGATGGSGTGGSGPTGGGGGTGGSGATGGSGGNLGSNFKNVVSKSQFEAMFPRRNAFYTYENLITATDEFSFFCEGGRDRQVQEAAAFLANVAHETQGLNYVEEACVPNCPNYCDSSNVEFPCEPGVAYYGRGPMQLTYNYNYGPAGERFSVDLLREPYRVASDGLLTFRTAVWFWMDRVTWIDSAPFTVHGKFLTDGFSGTTEIINPIECVPGNQQVQSRIDYYRQFLGSLGGGDTRDMDCRD